MTLAVVGAATYRRQMGSWLVILAFFAGPVTSLAVVCRLVSDPGIPGLRRLRRLVGVRPPAPVPAGRPIEAIARDAQRLGRQLQHADDGRSAARINAIRRS